MTHPSFAHLALPRRLSWPWNEPCERGAFWRDFWLEEAAPARLYVACSGSYRVWLDGRELAQPGSHLPSWRQMHRIALELSRGAHRLAFEVEQRAVRQPFLLANLDWEAHGQTARLASGADWRMLAEPPAGWVENLEDGAGRPAWAFDGVWAEPWGMPCDAPLDFCRLTTGWQAVECAPLTETARLQPGPAALGGGLEAHADGSLSLTPPLPFPPGLPKIEAARPRLEWYRTREAHSLINNTWLDLFEARCPAVVFDAGAETFARVRLRLRGGGPARLALTTGESLNEVERYARRVTDLIELRDGEEFCSAPTGFRYVKVLALSSGGAALELDPLEVQHIRYPLETRGSFACSDDALNRIFELSARTLHLCMQTEIWDGIKRDQLPWMGDLYTEVLAGYLLFGEQRLARRSLAVLGEVGPAPCAPLEELLYPGLQAVWARAGGDINDIPTYTMWWVVGLWDYWLYTGERGLIEALAPALRATLEHIAGWVGEDGLWRLQAGWDFVDWAPLSAQERGVYSHLLACRALDLGLRLLELAGQAAAPELGAALARASAAGRTLDLGQAHHTHAQAVCSGLLTPEEQRRVFAAGLAADPALSMTYWHRFLDLEAARLTGNIAWGLEYIRRHWGEMLKIGATALWEAFDPAWMGDDPHAVSMVGAGYARYGGYETSLAHGWSSGPAAWLLNGVLGVTPARPGFAAIRFAPDLGDLEWAEGTIPTPGGPVGVRLEKRGGEKPLALLRLPRGMEWKASAEAAEVWEIRRIGA